MHPGFPLFPTDSILLGLAVGEFLRLDKIGESDTFEEVLYRRVHPFYLDMAREVKTQITDRELPEGLVWYEESAGVERSGPAIPDDGGVEGWERSDVDPFLVAAEHSFERRGGQMFRITIDESERNMLDQLVEYLTADDEIPRMRWNERRAVLRRWKLGEGTKGPGPSGKSASEIAALIEELVTVKQVYLWPREVRTSKVIEPSSFGSLRETFTVGKILGRAFADCVAVEKSLIRLEESFDGVEEGQYVMDEYRGGRQEPQANAMIPLGIEETWRELVEALENDRVFLNCCFSADWIGNVKAFWNGRYFGLSRSSDPSASSVNLALCIRTSLCLILGEIMGCLRDKHSEAEIREPIPRRHSIPITARAEPIDDALRLAEHAIKGESGARFAPEVVVKTMGHLIEELCRRLWSFAPKEKVREVLEQKRRQNAGTTLEQEFAEKALFFYRIYRTRAEHPHMPFRCGAYEGPLFYYAMRSLRDISERILAERPRC